MTLAMARATMGGATKMAVRDWRRLAAALVCGAVGIAGGVWVQARFWPKPRPAPFHPGAAEHSGPPLAPSAIDWRHPPLPEGARVVFPVVRSSPRGLQAQYMCEAPLPPAAVRDFYQSQLARDGWTLYNGPEMGAAAALPGKNAAPGRLAGSLLFRRQGPQGRQSCWLTLFAAKDGQTAFRLSVLPGGR